MLKDPPIGIGIVGIVMLMERVLSERFNQLPLRTRGDESVVGASVGGVGAGGVGGGAG